MPAKKVCFAASSGGHFEQIMMLKDLMDSYDSFIVTEEAGFKVDVPGRKCYFLGQVNRRERAFPLIMLKDLAASLKIYFKERPDAVVTTGVLAMIPLCLITKLFGGKLIYIESFAKVKTPTKTGRFLYRFADKFYVQWPELLKAYPKAEYLGGIY